MTHFSSYFRPAKMHITKVFCLCLLLSSCAQTSFNSSAVDTPISSSELPKHLLFPTSNTANFKADIEAAKQLFLHDNYSAAYAVYEQITLTNPEDHIAWFGLAASADMLGNYEQAEAAYQRLQVEHGDSSMFRNNYGYSHMLRGNLTIAHALFTQVLNTDPHHQQAQNNLAMLRKLLSQANQTQE